jgi:hypothetical protein
VKPVFADGTRAAEISYVTRQGWRRALARASTASATYRPKSTCEKEAGDSSSVAYT